MPTPFSAPLSRRSLTLGAAGLGAAALLPTGSAAAGGRDHHHGGRIDWSARAEASWKALQKYLAADDGSGLYRERYPVEDDDPTYSYEWPFSQAHGAALDLTGMDRGGSRHRRALAAHQKSQEHYWSEAGSTGLPGYASGPMPPYAGGGDFFYDDNEWVGLFDIQTHLMHGSRFAVRRAEQIFDLVVSGWDDDPSHPYPGGVFWTQAPWSSDRNTVSNMPGAQLALRLHQLTGKRRYLDWALTMRNWTNEHLQRPDGLYHDNVKLDGSIDRTIWSYNQGVPVGVATLLHLVTRRREHLSEAQRIARAALAFYAEPDPQREGMTRLQSQPVFFNSIFFKNLLLLESVTGGRSHREAMARWADWVWNERRDAETGLFRFGTEATSGEETTEMIEQAAMVQTFAVLAWSPRRYRQLY